MASNNIVCKLSYADETRRFTLLSDDITYIGLHTRAEALFNFDPKANFKLQYKDDEGDVITMSTEDEMTEALALALSFNPPILRVSVKMDADNKPPTATAAPAASAPEAPDFASLFKNIAEQLPKVAAPNATGSPPDFDELLKKVHQELPMFVNALPECIRAHMPNAELDVDATLKANARANNAAAAKCSGVNFSVLPPCFGAGYGDKGVHPGVSCDKSGMCPIVGPRYNLKGHNYDLCEAEYNKLDPAEQAKFVRMDMPPWFSSPKWGWGRGGMAGGGGGGRCHMGGGGGGGHCLGGGKLAARFVSDVSIFDGTQMAPGTAFTKIWRMKNVGESPWPAGTKLLFVGGDRMAAEFTASFTDPSKVVMPGEETDVAVDMVAPTELGRYLGYWRLVGPLGRRRFGQRVWCHIQVVDPAGSVAPHDPNAVAAEISTLMAKAKKEDPDADDLEDEAGPSPAAEVASSSAAVSVQTDDQAAALVAAATEEALVAATTEEALVAAATEQTVKEPTKEPFSEDIEAPKEPIEATKEEAGASAGTEAGADPQNKVDVMTQLLQMGFDSKSVDLVLDKNTDVAPPTLLLEVCSRDLLQLSDWDEMLSDLEEMGFDDREKNKRLMIKNDGSVKRTVKDLVADN